MKNLISILCMGLSMLSMGLYGKNGVSGDLRWVGTRPPTDCPVSLGIPFLKGELEADGRVVLNDRDGADIPSDCWPLAYWPDGSVKWLGVAAVVPGEAEGIRFETARKKHKTENRSGAKYNPQIQISAESETKRSIFREKDKTKRSKKESAQHSKSRNKSFVMTSVSAL